MTDKLKSLTCSIGNLTKYISDSVIDKILEKNLNTIEPYKFLYTLLFKTNNGLDTANLLVCNLYSKPHFIDSAFLILRTILSDCIIYDYLLTLSKTDENLITNIKRLYYDHIDFAIKNLSIYKDAYKKSDKEIEIKKTELKQSKSEYFDNSGNPIFEKLNPLVSKAIKYIVSNRQKEVSIETPLEAFEYYDRFSKYEHLGDLTFAIIHRQFNEQEQNEVLLDIHSSIRIIIRYLKSFMLAWESEKFIDFYKFDILQNNLEHAIN